MDKIIKDTLKNSILKSLTILKPLTDINNEPYISYSRDNVGNWQWKLENRPSLRLAIDESRKLIKEINTEFSQLFLRYYPKYDNLMGISGLGQMGRMTSSLVTDLLYEMWERGFTSSSRDKAVDILVLELEEFVDHGKIEFRYMAELLNFRMERERIELCDGIVIRRLTEREVSEIYGGFFNYPRLMYNRRPSIQDCILEGKSAGRILFDPNLLDDHVLDEIKMNLEKVVIGLRCFKEGRVGFEQLRFKAIKYCPLTFGVPLFGDLYIPFGNYYIHENEVEPLQSYISSIYPVSEPIMKLACRKLADAETRHNAQDRLLDAIIGLEALLLSDISDKKYIGETRYRFALNYSSLPSDHPRDCFEIARDLYDARSNIVHGGRLMDGEVKVGNETLNLNEVARRACAILRDVIKHFLPLAKESPYTNPNYWIDQYFNKPPSG